jgi:hypothetical protein
LAGADGDADVSVVVDGDGASVEDEVSGFDWLGSPVDGAPVAGLQRTFVGKGDANGLVCAQGKPGAVEDVGSGSAPDVGFAELRDGVGNDGRHVGWDLAADTDDAATSGEVASIYWEYSACELAVGVEPSGLVFADREFVAVFGVRYPVEP